MSDALPAQLCTSGVAMVDPARVSEARRFAVWGVAQEPIVACMAYCDQGAVSHGTGTITVIGTAPHGSTRTTSTTLVVANN